MKYFTLLAGQPLNAQKIYQEIKALLKHEIPQLQEVDKVDGCDFILVFCAVVSQDGSDNKAVLKKLNHHSGIE